ncbi:LPXTG cell wall anchor domain-containing protein [Dactylosporangium sp. CA-139066]|uniref:LPXTG cell wall anchor domain-containing protein n=1 Tax=Dactylosporangium sp. CA-139066 TaxID=3239930 RepID=UPI003D94B74F
MNLRGIARAATAATVTALFIAGLGTPAHAADDDAPGAILNVPDTGIYAATAPNKGCAGIDTGVAVAGKDGWLFSKPAGEYTDLNYVFIYANGPADDEKTDAVALVLNAKGVFELDVTGDDPQAIESALAAKSDQISKQASAKDIELPTKPAPAGVTGKLVDNGGWIKTPQGWGLFFGFAVSVPLLDSSFDLVRACAAAVDSSPTARPSASPSGGPSLPVTGDNTGLIVGVGAGMVLVGAVLFVVYRRRRNVKFVA